jgi:cytosine/adenosine deaminase-related metal-dependent hydrolase
MGQLTEWLANTPVTYVNQGLFMARWVLPVDKPAIPHGFVRMDHGRIQAVGTIADLPTSLQATYNPENALLITPGLINTHTHLELTYPQCVPANAGMGPWLQAVVQLTRHSEHERYARIQAGICQLLSTGTTYCHDISRDGACVEALMAAGMSAQIALEFFHHGEQPFQPDTLIQHWERAQYSCNPSNHYEPCFQWGLSPHSIYNVHPTAWKTAVQYCQPAFIHTHLAESVDELAWITGQSNHGIATLHQQVVGQSFSCGLPQTNALQPFTTYLQDSGLADWPARFAHGVFLTPSEAQQLQTWGWQLLHCPRSNLHLSGKTVSVVDWTNLPLGTDSTLSSPNLDLRAEARVAVNLHGWTAAQAIQACTLTAANALQTCEARGSLTQGKRAELAIWHVPTFHQNFQPEALWLSEESTLQQVVLPNPTSYSRLHTLEIN